VSNQALIKATLAWVARECPRVLPHKLKAERRGDGTLASYGVYSTEEALLNTIHESGWGFMDNMLHRDYCARVRGHVDNWDAELATAFTDFLYTQEIAAGRAEPRRIEAAQWEALAGKVRKEDADKKVSDADSLKRWFEEQELRKRREAQKRIDDEIARRHEEEREAAAQLLADIDEMALDALHAENPLSGIF
jgi:hypothetical protein